MKRYLYFIIGYLMITLPMASLAATTRPQGIGKMANSMMSPVFVLSDFVASACIIIGFSFLLASVVKYFEHKRSPLMIPISTVVFLLIAGLLLVALPFAYKITSSGIPFTLIKLPGR